MDTNDNKIYIAPQNLMIRNGRLMIGDRWLCNKFDIPRQVFRDSVVQLDNRPSFGYGFQYWLTADDLGELMLGAVGTYFTIAQADKLIALLRGERG